MKRQNKYQTLFSFSLLLLIPSTLFAWQWTDLWQTADQQGSKLLQAGKAKEAAKLFKDKAWQGVASYRAGDYSQALKQFRSQKTSDGQYNAGNAAAYLGRYDEAIEAYEKAIALNPNNTDAITNKEIVKKLRDKQKEKQQNNSCKSKNNSTKDNKQNKENNSNDTQSQQNNSSEKNKNDKKNNANNQQKNQEEGQQQDNQKKDQQGQQDNQKNEQQKQQANSKSQSKPNNSSNTNENSSETLPNNLNTKQENTLNSASSQSQTQEDQKQILRRLPDDPGGLLRQKFLRDYMRRHVNDNDSGAGDI